MIYLWQRQSFELYTIEVATVPLLGKIILEIISLFSRISLYSLTKLANLPASSFSSLREALLSVAHARRNAFQPYQGQNAVICLNIDGPAIQSHSTISQAKESKPHHPTPMWIHSLDSAIHTVKHVSELLAAHTFKHRARNFLRNWPQSDKIQCLELCLK